jgi:serine/threonine protein kinase/AmiR/NasT family two-component response regulator
LIAIFMAPQSHTIDDSLPRETLRMRLDASSLLEGDELRQALKWLDAQANEVCRSFAVQALTSEGWLTPYQAQAVYDGRLKDLYIDHYDVLDRLGSGGMGTVFLARHRRMQRVVAIKVLSRSFSENASLVQRFQREVETAARLSHPNIVIAHDAGECDAGCYLVMEFVDGPDLDRLVRTCGTLSPALAATLILQAARGLEYAHSQGVIHRDIKPANLLIDGCGTLKITDLGQSRSAEVFNEESFQETSLTTLDGIMGTVDFMSPEQAFHPSQVDHRTDIYSLGCTLFFLLCGRPPYSGQTPMETLLLHQQGVIPSLQIPEGDMPHELADLFQRMLAKQPDERLASMSLIVEALERSGLTLSAIDLHAEVQRLRSADRNCSPQTSVPQLAAPPVFPNSLPTSSKRDLGSLAVLIADCSLTLRVHVRNTLTSLGLTRLTDVSDGAKAVAALDGQHFDLVITGLNLPRIDGRKLIEQIRQSSASCETPVLVMTTEATPEKLQALSHAGATATIDTSFRIDDVRALLDRLLSGDRVAERVEVEGRESKRGQILRIGKLERDSVAAHFS